MARKNLTPRPPLRLRRGGVGAYYFPLIILILLLGVWLRFHALVQDARFHPDEALFATFARHAAVQGDWLLRGPLDKTPLTIYANALAMTAFGVTTLPDGVLTLDVHRGEFAARLPGVFASILLMVVIYALAKALYGQKRTRSSVSVQVPFVALILIALSPFALAFSATAFTDGLMVLSVTLALWMGSHRRWLWAGLWLAVGFGCKQQALFYMPLVLGVGWVGNARTGHALSLRYLGRFLAPIVVGIILLLVWDAARGQSTSLWALAVANNEPGRLELAVEFLPRLSQWLGYAQYVAGYGWLTSILLLLSFVALIRRYAYKERNPIDMLLLIYTLVYLLLHAIAFNLYDRYLLLILPLLILLLARGINNLPQILKGTMAQRKKHRFVSLYLYVLALSLFPPALAATERRIPLGGDSGQYNGIDELGDYLNRKPLGTIIYDHWLGWELGYYMGTWSDKRRVYYPTPDALVMDALLQPDPAPRYWVVPDWVSDPSVWLTALATAGFEVTTDRRIAQFTVMKVIPPR